MDDWLRERMVRELSEAAAQVAPIDVAVIPLMEKLASQMETYAMNEYKGRVSEENFDHLCAKVCNGFRKSTFAPEQLRTVTKGDMSISELLDRILTGTTRTTTLSLSSALHRADSDEMQGTDVGVFQRSLGLDTRGGGSSIWDTAQARSALDRAEEEKRRKEAQLREEEEQRRKKENLERQRREEERLQREKQEREEAERRRLEQEEQNRKAQAEREAREIAAVAAAADANVPHTYDDDEDDDNDDIL